MFLSGHNLLEGLVVCQHYGIYKVFSQRTCRVSVSLMYNTI